MTRDYRINGIPIKRGDIMMNYIGIDAGTRSSAICVLNEKREEKYNWEGSNKKLFEEISQIKGDKKCVIEASPLSEHYCELIEELGAEIEIVDSRHTKAILNGKKKTDKIDAKVLAELASLGWYKAIYRKGGKARGQRTVMHGRDSLVKVSTKLKNTIRGLLKSHGIVLKKSSEGEAFVSHVRESISDLSEEIKIVIEDLLQVWQSVYERQRKSYKLLKKMADADEVTKRLMTVPGVGPSTALAFVSTIVNPTRFSCPKKVVGYLGLAPRVHQSGDTYYHGRISKMGDKNTRWLLVEAANVILTRVKTDFPLRTWGLNLLTEKGIAKARVAVARRLAIMLFTIWIEGSTFKVLENK